jgi:hypothetical protein
MNFGPLRASRILAAVYKTMYSRCTLHSYQRIFSCKRPWVLAPLSHRRPPGPGVYTCKTALAIQVYSFLSNKVRFLINSFTAPLDQASTAEYYYSECFHSWVLHILNCKVASTSTHFIHASWTTFIHNLNNFLTTLFILHMLPRSNPTGPTTEGSASPRLALQSVPFAPATSCTGRPCNSWQVL